LAAVGIRAVHKHFGSTHVIRGVDVDIADGEFCVLVGPSGCGKSTLLRMIAGLEEISEGEIIIGGRVVNRVPPKERDIAMVFQNYALYPHMTVRDNMSFALMLAKQSKVEIETRVKKAADILGLSGLLDRYPRQLSGGQRQRVALARAIVRRPAAFLMDEPLSNLDAKLRGHMRAELKHMQNGLGITTIYVTHDQIEAMTLGQRVALARAMVREPSVFLLDEPLSNLDAKLRTSARDELQRFQRRLGTTTIYVTHDQIEAMGLGHRIAVMSKGKVRQLGPPQEVYNDPADTFVAGFLGSPPMNFFERGDAIVGFRPEQILPKGSYSTQEPLVDVCFRVDRVENLGADRLLYGSLRDLAPEVRMIINLSSTVHLEVTEGQAHQFSIKQKDLKFFHKETGLRIPGRPL